MLKKRKTKQFYSCFFHSVKRMGVFLGPRDISILFGQHLSENGLENTRTQPVRQVVNKSSTIQFDKMI